MEYDEKECSVLQGGNGKMMVTLEVTDDIWGHSFYRIIKPEFKW